MKVKIVDASDKPLYLAAWTDQDTLVECLDEGDERAVLLGKQIIIDYGILLSIMRWCDGKYRLFAQCSRFVSCGVETLGKDNFYSSYYQARAAAIEWYVFIRSMFL
jgi:hypothetical protein